jgi:serine/threonine protein kinase
MPDRTGQHLGRYRLLKCIGVDGPTELYFGINMQTNAQAVLKVTRAPAEAVLLQQFRARAEALARLKHPYIVHVQAYGQADGLLYLAMNPFPQNSLRQIYPQGRRLDPATLVHHVGQVATALQYAHDQGVLHLNLCPENLLPGPPRNILLNNFSLPGFARSAASVPYTALEEAQGQGQVASDQYALGAMAYEWICGALPSTRGRVTRPLHTLVPGIPASVEQVVLRTLETDWQERFNTVRDFAEALEQSLTATHISHTPSIVRAVPASEPIAAPIAPARGPLPPAVAPQSVAPTSEPIAAPTAPARELLPPAVASITPQPAANVVLPRADVVASQASMLYAASAPSVSTPAPPPPPPISTEPPPINPYTSAAASAKPYTSTRMPTVQYQARPVNISAPIYVPVQVPVIQTQPPVSPIHFPLTRNAPLQLQIFGMLAYGLVLAIGIMVIALYMVKAYDPGSTSGIYTNLDDSVNYISIVLTVVLVLLVMPASSILSGAFFGSWRGTLLSLCIVYGGLAITHLSDPTFFWNPASWPDYLILAPLPVSAMIVGLVYDRRQYSSWWKSLFTLMLGYTLIIGSLYALILVVEYTSLAGTLGVDTSDATAITNVVLGCFSVCTVILLTLPTACIEGIVHASVVRITQKK